VPVLWAPVDKDRSVGKNYSREEANPPLTLILILILNALTRGGFHFNDFLELSATLSLAAGAKHLE